MSTQIPSVFIGRGFQASVTSLNATTRFCDSVAVKPCPYTDSFFRPCEKFVRQSRTTPRTMNSVRPAPGVRRSKLGTNVYTGKRGSLTNECR